MVFLVDYEAVTGKLDSGLQDLAQGKSAVLRDHLFQGRRAARDRGGAVALLDPGGFIDTSG